MVLCALRRLGLRGTRLARARCDTIRLQLLRMGVQVRATVRRVWVRMASSYAYQDATDRSRRAQRGIQHIVCLFAPHSLPW